MAPGHAGHCPEEFLKTTGAQRIRIPGGSTWVLQPADRPTTNFRLKAIVRKSTGCTPYRYRNFVNGTSMRKLAIREKLAKEFDRSKAKITDMPLNSLSGPARSFIAEVLDDVKRKFNNEEKLRSGIRQAFDETFLGKPHKGLQKVLDFTAGIPNPPPNNRERATCHLCKESWASKYAKGFKNHNSTCWFRREEVMAPVFHANAVSANRPFTITGLDQFMSLSKQ